MGRLHMSSTPALVSGQIRGGFAYLVDRACDTRYSCGPAVFLLRGPRNGTKHHPYLAPGRPLRRTHEVLPMSGEQEIPAEAESPEEGQNAPQGDGRGGQTPEGSPRAQGGEAPRNSRKKGEPPPEPVAGAYHVALPTFEGPLDLLLHLIQQHELDIKDIPILFISQKYVEYIMLMQNLNIDLASEYLVMAATLAHIKSKMLLPKPPVDQDDDNVEDLDPRAELVRRLLEYQKYKNAAEQLGQAPVLGRDVFLRGAPAPMVDGPAQLAQVSVFKLFDAFHKLLSRVKQQADHLIDVDRISISERIIELTDLLRGRGRIPFLDLFDASMTRSDLIVSFLAVLEMTRLRMMVVLQEGPLAPIEIELTLASEHDDVLSRSDGVDPLVELSRLGDEKEEGITRARSMLDDSDEDGDPDEDDDPAEDDDPDEDSASDDEAEDDAYLTDLALDLEDEGDEGDAELSEKNPADRD
jgi:segregation and condensation protein A